MTRILIFYFGIEKNNQEKSNKKRKSPAGETSIYNK